MLLNMLVSCHSAILLGVSRGSGVQGLLGAVNAGLHAKKRSMSTSRPLLQTQAARRQQEARLADALTAVHAAQDVIQGDGLPMAGLLWAALQAHEANAIHVITQHPTFEQISLHGLYPACLSCASGIRVLVGPWHAVVGSCQ